MRVLLLLFDGERRQEGGNAALVQKAAAVGVLVQIEQAETRLQLAAELFFQRVRKLKAGIVPFERTAVFFVCQRVEGETVFDYALLFSEQVIEAVVQAAEQPPPFFSTRKHSHHIGRTSRT